MKSAQKEICQNSVPGRAAVAAVDVPRVALSLAVNRLLRGLNDERPQLKE